MSTRHTALIMIRLDAAAGRWMSVDELAAHYGLTKADVAAELLRLEVAGYARLSREADRSNDAAGAIACAIATPCRGQPVGRAGVGVGHAGLDA